MEEVMMLEDKKGWYGLKAKMMKHFLPSIFTPFTVNTRNVYNMARYTRRVTYGWDDIPVDGCNSITPKRDLPLDSELYDCIYRTDNVAYNALECYKQFLLLYRENEPEGEFKRFAAPLITHPLAHYGALKLYAFLLTQEGLSKIKYESAILSYMGLLLPYLNSFDEVFKVIDDLQKSITRGEIFKMNQLHLNKTKKPTHEENYQHEMVLPAKLMIQFLNIARGHKVNPNEFIDNIRNVSPLHRNTVLSMYAEYISG